MNLLKTIARTLPILFIVFWSCQSDEENVLETDLREQEVENYLADAEERFSDPAARQGAEIDPVSLNPCNAPEENMYPLIAWGDNPVGNVSVSNDENYLIATFNSDPDWYLKHTKFVGVVKELKGSKYHYKKYVYPVQHETGTSEYTYVIPMEELGLDIEQPDQSISFMAIAHVNADGGHSRHQRLALAENQGSNSFLEKYLIDYVINDCQDPVEICTLAWVEGDPYSYGEGETGFTDLYTEERERDGSGTIYKNVYAYIEGDDITSGIVVGTAEINYFYSAGVENTSVVVDAEPGYILKELKIEIGSRRPNTEPNDYVISEPDGVQSIAFNENIEGTAGDKYITVAAIVCEE